MGNHPGFLPMMFPNGHLPRSTVGTDRPDNFSLNKSLKSLSVATTSFGGGVLGDEDDHARSGRPSPSGTDRPDNFSLNKPLKSLSVPTREPGFPDGIQQVRGGVWAEGAEEVRGPGNPVPGLPRMPRKEFSGRPDIPPTPPAPSTRTMERG